MLDEDPDGHLVGQADAGADQAALGDLAAQYLQVLGHPGGQPVPELGIGLEPLELVVRASHLERRPGDLRGTRQRGRGALVEQPRAAPHQGDQEQLGLRVEVERQHGAVAVRLRLARLDRARLARLVRLVRVLRGPGAAAPPGDGDRDLQPVVKHRARADHRRARVDEPAARRVPVSLHPRQPDPVAVTRHVKRMSLADVGDPGALWCRGDHAGPPGEATPSGDGQVDLRTSPEYQLAAFGEPDDLARRGDHLRGHQISLGRGPARRAPPNSGMARPPTMRLAAVGETPSTALGTSLEGPGPAPEGGEASPGGDDPVRWPGGVRRLASFLSATAATAMAVAPNPPNRR